MGKHKITAGQNIYDVAMHLYGSIEGIVDLLINNPELSLDDTLKSGEELEYTDGFTISPDIVAYNRVQPPACKRGKKRLSQRTCRQAFHGAVHRQQTDSRFAVTKR